MATHSKGENITKTVSMDTDLWVKADGRRQRLRFRSFSEYIRRLIEDDLGGGGDYVIREDPPAFGKTKELRKSK